MLTSYNTWVARSVTYVKAAGFTPKKRAKGKEDDTIDEEEEDAPEDSSIQSTIPPDHIFQRKMVSRAERAKWDEAVESYNARILALVEEVTDLSEHLKGSLIILSLPIKVQFPRNQTEATLLSTLVPRT
ncbi:MAG: hypothetical protein Q9210_001792 [Variospora velana]